MLETVRPAPRYSVSADGLRMIDHFERRVAVFTLPGTAEGAVARCNAHGDEYARFFQWRRHRD